MCTAKSFLCVIHCSLLLQFIDYIFVDDVNNFIEPVVSFASQAEFYFCTRLLNEPSRTNLLVDRALASRTELAQLGFQAYMSLVKF
jgi:hypothetical protein